MFEGAIEFLGYPYSIFQAGSVERLVACAMARQNSDNYGEETIRREKKRTRIISVLGASQVCLELT